MADIIGRFVPHSLALLSTRRGLNHMSLMKLAATPLTFWYIAGTTGRSDFLAIVYIGLFWLQSGAVNSAAFVMATRWASRGNQGRASGFMALVFQASCLVALGLAFIIQSYFPPTEASRT